MPTPFHLDMPVLDDQGNPILPVDYLEFDGNELVLWIDGIATLLNPDDVPLHAPRHGFEQEDQVGQVGPAPNVIPISDEDGELKAWLDSVGTGAFVRSADGLLTNPVLGSPEIDSFAEANHNHNDDEGGGKIPPSATLFTATNKLLGRSTSGAGEGEEIACTPAGRALLDDASADAQLDTLGGASATGAGGVVRSIGPTLINPKLNGSILDTNGNELIKQNAVRSGSEVNEITIKNATTTNPPSVEASGDDTNINLLLVPKGTGKVKVSNTATDRLLGRDTASDGDSEEISVGGGLEFTGSGGIQRSALTGDVTASAGSSATTIPNGTVTYAKIQDVSATDKLLGRSSSGSGDVEEIPCTAQGRALIDDSTALAQRTTMDLCPDPYRKRLMQVLKDAGATTVTVLGLPAPTLDGASTGNADDASGPLLTHITGTSVGNTAGINSAAYTAVRRDWEVEFIATIQTHSNILSTRIWVGLFSANPDATQDITLLHGAAFRYDTAVDGTAFWRCVTNDGGATPTVTTTTAAIALSSNYKLRIVCDNTSGDVKFYVDDVLVATHTTDLPAATQTMGYAIRVTNLIGGGAAKRIKWGRIAILHN